MSKAYAKKSVEDKRKEVEELTKGMEQKVEQHFHSADELKETIYLSHWTKGKSFEDKTKLLKEVHETSVGFIETIEDTLVKEREKNQSPEKNDEKQQQADLLSSTNVHNKMKEGYGNYIQKQREESVQDVDSILE
ncbi:hypothetical protein V7054_26050, partial [Priestia megaterium]